MAFLTKLNRVTFIVLPLILAFYLTDNAVSDSHDHLMQPAQNLPLETPKPPLNENEIFPQIAPPNNSQTQAIKPPVTDSPIGENDFSVVQKRKEEENRLFAQLKRTANIKKAAKISRSIESLWAQSGNETVDLLMQWANKEIAEKNYTIALDFLDNVVALAPDYAEGWMRRASVHIMTNDTALAVVEMWRVLQLEPRQYNAMLQLGAIMEITRHSEQALKFYEKALEFYPQMQSAQRRIQELIEKRDSRAA